MAPSGADGDAGADAYDGARPPSPPSPPSDAESVSRPSAYPTGHHVPSARRAPFEAYYGAGPGALRELELLDELKGARLEGLYNLSFLVLIFALFYLAVRNVAEHGLLAGAAQLCPAEAARDAALCAAFAATAISAVSAAAYSVAALQTASTTPHPILAPAHALFDVAVLALTSIAVVRSPVNPLFGGVLSVAVVSVVLKAHSYVVTNTLLAEEVAAKRAARAARRAARAAAATSFPRPMAAARKTPACDSTDSLGASSCGSTGTANGNSSAAPTATATATATATDSATASGISNSVSNSVGGAASVAGRRAASRPPRPAGRRSFFGGGRAGSFSVAVAGTGDGSLVYPENVTLANFLFFMVAPTLTYELNYPRTDSVRADYILWQAGQVVVCLAVQYMLLMQFCAPVFRAIQGVSFGETVLLLLRLAIPAFSIFLLTFWGFFHCILSLIAELLRFADRGFYRDWWNATSVTAFWRTWNVPVHEWCHRHIFFELNRRRNVSAPSAAAGVFLVSALLHEYVVATAFKVTPFSGAGWMFLGMCVQLPLMYLDRHWKGTRNGNLVMWLSLFLGQPLIVILYVRGYIRERGFLMCS